MLAEGRNLRCSAAMTAGVGLREEAGVLRRCFVGAGLVMALVVAEGESLGLGGEIWLG